MNEVYKKTFDMKRRYLPPKESYSSIVGVTYKNSHSGSFLGSKFLLSYNFYFLNLNQLPPTFEKDFTLSKNIKNANLRNRNDFI